MNRQNIFDLLTVVALAACLLVGLLAYFDILTQ